MSAPYYRVGQYAVDNSNPAAPVLYRCTTAGDKTTSVWAKISGAGGAINTEAYDNSHAYNQGDIAWVDTQQTIGGVLIQPGHYLCITGVPTAGTGNEIPQFPLPTSGTIYWRCLAFGPVVTNVCSSSGTSSIYINATGQF